MVWLMMIGLAFFVKLTQVSSFIQHLTILFTSRNVIFLIYFTSFYIYCKFLKMQDDSFGSLSIWFLRRNLLPWVFLTTPSTCWASSAAFHVVSIFLTFKVPQRYENTRLCSSLLVTKSTSRTCVARSSEKQVHREKNKNRTTLWLKRQGRMGSV